MINGFRSLVYACLCIFCVTYVPDLLVCFTGKNSKRSMGLDSMLDASSSYAN